MSVLDGSFSVLFFSKSNVSEKPDSLLLISVTLFSVKSLLSFRCCFAFSFSHKTLFTCFIDELDFFNFSMSSLKIIIFCIYIPVFVGQGNCFFFLLALTVCERFLEVVGFQYSSLHFSCLMRAFSQLRSSFLNSMFI